MVVPANSGRVGALVFSLTVNELAQGKLFIEVSAVVGTAWPAVVAASCQASQSCLTGPEKGISIRIWIWKHTKSVDLDIILLSLIVKREETSHNGGKSIIKCLPTST